MSGWRARDMGDQTGRVAVVTGANSGVGFHAALELARRGTRVVLACRDERRGREALDRIRRDAAVSDVTLATLDLADLASVRRFAASFVQHEEPLDVLVNNAGVMAIPTRRTTADGFEMQFGTNHLGHFALTGLLLPALLRRAPSRVLTVSSFNHRLGRIGFEDLQGASAYRPWRAYNQSKLANLLFAVELQRRADAAGVALVSAAVHPGYAATRLQSTGPEGASLRSRVMAAVTPFIAQSAAGGALPILYAATAPSVVGGAFYGPAGPLGLWGGPSRARIARRAQQGETAGRLWKLSEELTGVEYRWATR